MPPLRGVPHGIPTKMPEDATAATGGLHQCEWRDPNHSGDSNAMARQRQGIRLLGFRLPETEMRFKSMKETRILVTIYQAKS